MVLAVVDGEYTVKFLKKNDFKCWLVPANRKYKEILVTPEMNMTIWGVVIQVFFDPKTVSRCMR